MNLDIKIHNQGADWEVRIDNNQGSRCNGWRPSLDKALAYLKSEVDFLASIDSEDSGGQDLPADR